MRTLVAALGSTLRGDDGFGPAVLRALPAKLPPGTVAVDFGTHGLALVQRLYDGFDALVLIDACARGAAPGTVFVMVPNVPATPPRATPAGLDALADVHLADPAKALILARELEILPASLWMVGCEAGAVEGHRVGLSDAVSHAVPAAAKEVVDLIDRLGRERGRPSR